jgi:hypothetical protein
MAEELRTLVGQDIRLKLEETEGEPLSLEGYSKVYRVVAENPWGLFVRGEEGLLFIPWPVAGWIHVVETYDGREHEEGKRLAAFFQRNAE